MYTYPVSFSGPWDPSKSHSFYNLSNRVRNYGGQVVRDSDFLTMSAEKLSEIKSRIGTGRAQAEFAEQVKKFKKARKDFQKRNSRY